MDPQFFDGSSSGALEEMDHSHSGEVKSADKWNRKRTAEQQKAVDHLRSEILEFKRQKLLEETPRQRVMNQVIAQFEKHPTGRISAIDRRLLIGWAKDFNAQHFVLGYLQMVEVICNNRRKQLLRQPSMTLKELKTMVVIDEDLMEILLLKHYLEPIDKFLMRPVDLLTNKLQ